MRKSKISKLNLLSYLDGELGETDSIKVKDYLMESEGETHFLEEIVKTEKQISNDDEIVISDRLESTIFDNANRLLSNKRNMIEQRELKRKHVKKSLSDLRDILPKLSFKFSYEYVALCSLILVLIGFIRTPRYEGDIVAFEMKPQVVSAEADYEYLNNEKIGEGE